LRRNNVYLINLNQNKMAFVYHKINPLSLSEVKELIREVDVEKKAEKFIGCEYDDIEDSIDQISYDSFIRGYNQALEDNKDRKYTEEDIDKAYWAGMQFVGEDKGSFGEFIQSIHPQTENAEVREFTGLSPD
jgi:hypothetical protein